MHSYDILPDAEYYNIALKILGLRCQQDVPVIPMTLSMSNNATCCTRTFLSVEYSRQNLIGAKY